MSVLEGYSDHECSLLLKSTPRDVVVAKAAALKHLAASARSKDFLQASSHARQQLAPTA